MGLCDKYKTSALLTIVCLFVMVISSCSNHIENGDEYFALATEAVNNDSIIRAYSLTEKAIEEYGKSGDMTKEYKARIFLALLYFSTNQKDKAYEIIQKPRRFNPQAEDYPLYSNYYRIKAFYKSVYEDDLPGAIAMMDSVLYLDSIYANSTGNIINIDRLNKCEILLNAGDTTNVKGMIDLVIDQTALPGELEPQVYANLARWHDFAGQQDSACKYAKLVLETTSRIHQDIDNNIYALDIILRYDSLDNNLGEYIHYRNMLENLKAERQDERIMYGMAFAKERDINENLRLNAKMEMRSFIWISVSVLLAFLMLLLFLYHKQKAALARNEIIQLECDRLDAVAFRRKLENELLLRKINLKSDELAKANNEILELSQRIERKKQPKTAGEPTYLQRLLESVDETCPGFQRRLMEKYPDITKTELIMACLLRLNLSSDEITTAMSISKAGLIKARYRLRKRLGIESSSMLDCFLSGI